MGNEWNQTDICSKLSIPLNCYLPSTQFILLTSQWWTNSPLKREVDYILNFIGKRLLECRFGTILNSMPHVHSSRVRILLPSTNWYLVLDWCQMPVVLILGWFIQSCGSLSIVQACPSQIRWCLNNTETTYSPKISVLRFWYTVVSFVTRGASTSRINASFDSPGRSSCNWSFATWCTVCAAGLKSSLA